MKLYGISGLGADKRIFDYLSLDCKFIPIDWIEPKQNESISSYSIRLAEVIEKGSNYGILGVSFGGLVATEISKTLSPKVTILISSAETKDELRPIFRAIGKTNLLRFFPFKLFDPPRKLAHFLFGTQQKELLNQILDDTDFKFTKWAVNELVNWTNEKRLSRVLKIGGTNDKLIPQNRLKNIHLIEGGEHFMIVDKAEEISKLINEQIEYWTS